MRPHTITRGGLSALLATLLFTPALRAQSATAAPDPQTAHAEQMVRTCTDMAAAKQTAEAAAVGRRAEAFLQARLAAQPRDVEATVALARALSQCILPSADLMSQGELSTRAIELLEGALQLEPRHWVARYVLASIYFRSPSFLGRGPKAAMQFDQLLRQQGDDATNPRYARVFEYRGILFTRTGQPDSARAIWQRGAGLFPADTTLRGLVERATPRAGGAPPGTPPAAAALAPVRVVGSSATPPRELAERRVSKSQILRAPGAAADVMQAVQMQPGATHVTEGSDIYTRGGDANETAVLVDGGRVAAISRFEGLNGGMFGAIEPFVVRSIRYSSGGFSARHGNALSGVVEIETDGRPRERQLRAGLSLVQASGTARAPLGHAVGGWVSARVSQTAALLATHGRAAQYLGAPYSAEAIGALIANPSPTSELRATAIVEQDDARPLVDAGGWEGPFHSAGRARALLLSSRWVAPHAPVVVRTGVAASTRSSDWEFGALARVREERGALARMDAEWAPTEAVALRGGVEQGTFTRSEHGTVPTTSSVAPGSPLRAADASSGANQIGAYVEAQLAHEVAAITLGMRADRLPGERDVTLDPRVAATIQRGAWRARLSGGVFHQGRWRGAPAIPDASTPSGLARTAQHQVIGLEHESATITLKAEAYRKRYRDYSAFGTGPQIARGRAAGIDVIAEKPRGRITGFLGYSLLDAALDLVDGRTTRSPFDATQSVTGTATAAVTADWSVGSTLRYGTGLPRTPVLGGVERPDGGVDPVYGDLMSDRLPSYVRADVRLMRFIRAPGFLLTTFVEVLNATNRRNVSGVTYDAAYRAPRPVHPFFATRTVVAGGEFQFR